MKNKRNILIRASAILFVIIGLKLISNLRSQNEKKLQTQVTRTPLDMKSKNESVAESKDNTQAEITASDSQNKISDEQYQLWSKEQIQNLEVPVKNPITYEENIKKTVNQLSKDQINDLKSKVINSKLPMNERIFSNYALMLFDAADSNQTIYELLIMPVPDFKNVQPHTENEIKRAQEYALKYIEIDELAKRSESGDNQARILLSQVAQNSIDLKIKNYAERKLKEIR